MSIKRTETYASLEDEIRPIAEQAKLVHSS
jgi:hypothetical protein